MFSNSINTEVVKAPIEESKSRLQIKSYQNLIEKYARENKTLKANLLIAYAILRYEFFYAFMIAITIPIGWKQSFNFFELNPLTLTKAQSQKRPTLLLHGVLHNQGIWLYLAKTLQSRDLGPIFTMNIPFSITSIKNSIENSFYAIDKKIIAIQQLYLKWSAEPISINIVGYSAGALFAYFTSLDQTCWSFDSTSGFPWPSRSMISNPNIHTVICIGSRLHPSMPNMYEIVGEEDILVPPLLDETLQNEGKQKTVRCGHLNLLFSTITIDHIFQILSRDKNIKSVSSENKNIIPKIDLKNEDRVEFIQQEKYNSSSSFFKCKQNKAAHPHLNESKPASRPMLSCTIL